MKIGEYIYCHTTGRMNGDGEIFVYKGCRYKITERGNGHIWFTDENNKDHCWPLDDNESIDLFHKYFSVIPKILTKYKTNAHTFKF